MAELADCVDLLEAVTDPKRGNLTEEDLKELLKESGIVLKKAGVAVQKLDQESLKALRDGLVGVIVTGSQHKSYCAGLGKSHFSCVTSFRNLYPPILKAINLRKKKKSATNTKFLTLKHH